ncbi:MAG: 1-deoxy-D-xylulose-5-phosphate reductoisomerase [Deltaproteobacteria bacterium]|nr:1-deoxy-D-xylulose-5-phosphate reductoisomerase [Deltaproteobacteria bacterium]
MNAGAKTGAKPRAKRLALLGSTGSIGVQTLEVAAEFPGRFEVAALAAGRNAALLAEQVQRFRPGLAAVADAETACELRQRLAACGVTPPPIATGDKGLIAAAECACDLVVAGLVGAVGLRPTLAALRAGRSVALANKEVLVMAGGLVRRAMQQSGAELLPVDSEHSAIFQALAGQRPADVARLVLTASGGPFRTWSAERMAQATPEQALAHPNWQMGAKVTIDSATLMNKALEVIEARWLFGAPPERIAVLLHPQSIVHSLVEFVDGALLAQLGLPDMRVPIALALSHPERLPLAGPRLDLAELARLDFAAPDAGRFPCLPLAWRALAGGETAPAALNAANEVAVAAFLAEEIPFPAIAAINARALNLHLRAEAQQVNDSGGRAPSLDDILCADAAARAAARRHISEVWQ